MPRKPNKNTTSYHAKSSFEILPSSKGHTNMRGLRKRKARKNEGWYIFLDIYSIIINMLFKNP